MRALSTRYDAMDSAVREMSMPFAEVDATGLIVYANKAFQRLVPNGFGRPFADLFGERGDEVKAALAAGVATSLLVEMPTPGALFLQFRVAIGPLADEDGKTGAFALLVDMGGEDRLYDSAPDGILRINSTDRITFANQRACELLNVKAAALVGQPASIIFRSGSIREKTTNEFKMWSSRNEGKKTNATFLRFGTRERVPVVASVLPTYHSRDHRAGTLIAFNTTAAETAHRKLQKLLATPCPPDALALGVLRAIRGVVPYDLATFGVYTPDMKFFRVLATDPPKHWKIRWFPLNPAWPEWLRQGITWTSNLLETVTQMDPRTLQEPVFREIQQQNLNCLLTFPIEGGNGSYRSAVSLLSMDRVYDKSHLNTLSDLGVREAFNAAEKAFERVREQHLRELKKALANARNADSLAQHLARGMADCFRWDYVAVYKVNRLTRHFEVIAQYHFDSGQMPYRPRHLHSAARGRNTAQGLDLPRNPHGFRDQ